MSTSAIFQGSVVIDVVKLKPACLVDDNGDLIIPIDEFHDYEKVHES